MSLRDRRTRVFEAAVDALVYVLAVVVAVRVAVDGGPRWPLGVALAVAVAGIHLAGCVPTRRHGRAAAVWFAGLVAVWIALVVVDVAGVYLGFALFFVALDRFAARAAVAVVAGLTAVVVIAELVHQPSLGAAAVVGPVIGAVVAVVMGLGYRSLERENDARRTLIAELHRTQDELAVAEHGRGVLEERERLAREIHDTVAQGLASIVILLGATDQELRQGDHESALEHIAQARDTARHDLDEARRFVRELAPVALDGASLTEALEQLCAQTTRLGGPAVAFAVSGPPHALPPAHELALLRVAQSALANTVAHADARQGRVTLTYLADGVALDIHDDGCGFDPTAPRPGPSATAPATRATGATASGTTAEPAPAHGGFGLVAMRQRVDALGGTFTVESAPGEGTVIAVNLPAELPAGPAGVTAPPSPAPPRPLDPRSTHATTDASGHAPRDATTGDAAGRSVAGTRP